MDNIVQEFCERGMQGILRDISINTYNVNKVVNSVKKIKRKSTFGLVVAGFSLFTVSRLYTENQIMKERLINLESKVEELETMKG